MQEGDKILKDLFLIDLQKDIINNNISNNDDLLSRIRNYDLPNEYKKIVVVNAYSYKKRKITSVYGDKIHLKWNHTSVNMTYKNSYELITEFPFEHFILMSTKIEQDTLDFENAYVSTKIVKQFYKELIDKGYFEKYLQFLGEIFKISNKEYMETFKNEDKNSSKKILQKKMKKEVIK